MITRAFGYRPSPPKGFGEKPDFDAALKLKAGPVPARSDNRRLFPDWPEQGYQGSCVAHAVMTAVRAAQIRLGAVNAPLGSRAWTYYLARSYSNETNDDNGTFLRVAFAALVKFGFPPEADFPYDPAEFRRAPSFAVFRKAEDQQAPTEYHRILSRGHNRVDDVKRALGAGYGVCFGTPVSRRFADNDLGSKPVEPPVGEPIVGNHAMVLADHEGDDFRGGNWWGPDWGDRGSWHMSADWVASDLVDDLWIVEQTPLFAGGVHA